MHMPKVIFKSKLKIMNMKMKEVGLSAVSELFVSVKVFGSTVSVSCGIQSVCALQLFSKLSLCMLFRSFLTSVKQVGATD